MFPIKKLLAWAVLAAVAAAVSGNPTPPDRDFNAYPRVFRTGSTGQLTIEFAPGVLPEPTESLRVRWDREDLYHPDQPEHYLGCWLGNGFLPLPFEREGDRLTVPLQLDDAELERRILVEQLDGDGAIARQLASFPLYVLKPDLFALRPFRGDLHLHSRRSDGSIQPEEAAKRCRAAGYDFFALTDHYTQQGSRDAAEALKKYDTELVAIPGEEVSPYEIVPDLFGHFAALNAASGISDRIKTAPDAFRNRVAAIMATLPPEWPAPTRRHVAGCEAVAEWIHEAGGVAVFSHPFWVTTGTKFNSPIETTLAVMRRGKFDSIDIFSARNSKAAVLGSNFYTLLCREGIDIAPSASSDEHGTMQDGFGVVYTILFAAANTPDELMKALKNGNSVAVRSRALFTREDGSPERPEEVFDIPPQLAGEFRLAKYAEFLLREYFPEQRRITAWESLNIFKLDAGTAPGRPPASSVSELQRRFWALP
ncbi:CehA/McbA family metallohydrolase [Victivallis sp. Marseille-Q1083]|uniref:CehA/McbA family metallohydrolase n=1 Tax=Victivallis sp. Marseille-Q1083 TaxID=2717288 RepID=UPI00158DA811|nr:CehA/McbA family metallohydrolase [Victivallis sp. Marseille-Q1083]